MQRVVSRSELRSESPSPRSSPGPDTLEKLKHLDSYEVKVSKPINIDATEQQRDTNAPAAEENEENEDEELAFHLFSRVPTSTTAPIPKIRLHSPPIDPSKIGFIKSARDSSYYFTLSSDAKKRAEFHSAALSGPQILSLAQKIPWPGCAYPWKIMRLPESRVREQVVDPSSQVLVENSVSRKRTRAGKKSRIRTRTKFAVLREKQEARKMEVEAKEAAEREKRTLRNREKKVKRKMREKEKKADQGDDRIVDVEVDAG